MEPINGLMYNKFESSFCFIEQAVLSQVSNTVFNNTKSNICLNLRTILINQLIGSITSNLDEDI